MEAKIPEGPLESLSLRAAPREGTFRQRKQGPRAGAPKT